MVKQVDDVHDCMEAGGRATPGAVAEEAQVSREDRSPKRPSESDRAGFKNKLSSEFQDRHYEKTETHPCRDGGTGRRAGFKIQFWQQSGGSIPPPGTNLNTTNQIITLTLIVFGQRTGDADADKRGRYHRTIF